jgi:hypothetical protein
MARLKSRYRDLMAVEGASDVQAPETAAANEHTSAAAAVPLLADGGNAASSRLRGQVELMRERVSNSSPPSTEVDDAVEAATQAAVSLDRETPDPEPEDDLGKNGLPPLACHWLRNNPDYLYDVEKNQRLQDLHWVLVDEGHEPYSPAYFLEVDKRLNGHGAQPELFIDEELAAAEQQLEEVERKRDRISAVNKRLDQVIEETQSPVDRVLNEIRAGRNNNPAVDAKPRRTIPPVSAPPSRETPTSNGARGSSRVTLSPAQKEAARIAGVSIEDYARHLIRLNEEKASGNYGGAP